MSDPIAAHLDEVRAASRVCPIHAIPDCSPLLNGCSFPTWGARRIEAALRAALGQHTKVVGNHINGPTLVCEQCSEDRMFALWPCPTVKAAATELGVEVPS